MPRIRRKQVKTFALNIETLERLREVAQESGVTGGQSGIVENAVASWLKRYTLNPREWLANRGMAAPSEPMDDDI